MTRTPHRASRFLAGALALSALGLSSCNIGVPAMYIIQGPPKIEAVTRLDDSRRTVIFIDDPLNVVPTRALRTAMGQAAERNLLEKKVIGANNLISSVTIMRIASSESADSPSSVVDLGRKAGAEVVVHVQMTKWTLAKEPSHLSPLAGATVKIIDAVSNTRIWPEQPSGYGFGAEIPQKTDVTSLPPSERSRWERALADQFGVSLAQLFYTRERESLSTQR